jgi:hypothetical protein
MAIMENNSPRLPAEAEEEPARRKIHRPAGVTILALLVLSCVAFSLVRLVQAVSQWDYLLSLRSFLPAYLAASAILWGSIGLSVFLGLWFGKWWAPNATRLASIFFLIFYWIENLWVIDPAGRSLNQFFIFGLQLAWLAFVFGNLARPAAKQYFRRNL